MLLACNKIFPPFPMLHDLFYRSFSSSASTGQRSSFGPMNPAALVPVTPTYLLSLPSALLVSTHFSSSFSTLARGRSAIAPAGHPAGGTCGEDGSS
mmetsp:Transcript_35696/g.80492  ORF Transcript_35696/g.80492 Transcript_35696/m.80492 type:complete len:96 (-) Transcript_35696:1275-1562(-)